MDNILGGVVFAPGDIDLLAADSVVVVFRQRTGAHLGEIRPRLGFGEIHGPRPGAFHQFGQVGRFEHIAAVMRQCFNSTSGQHRAEP